MKVFKNVIHFDISNHGKHIIIQTTSVQKLPHGLQPQ